MQEQSSVFGWRRASDLLGAWSLYFVAKLALFAMGLIGLHLVENLVFVVLLAALSTPRLRRWRPWVGVPIALALLYYDSWLPGLSRVVSQAGLVAGFSGAYLAELAGRFVNPVALAVTAVAVAVAFAALRFVRIDALVVVAMVAMALAMSPPGKAPAAPVAASGTAAKPSEPVNTPDAQLADFLAKEAKRSVSFAAPAADAAPFDVIFVHVCSLSWDDIEAAGLSGHPLLASFDILLKRFNSVSTYSGPAAIRFLRAPCGQPSHKGLYVAAAPQCLLMPGLQAAGFETQLAMNHDGHFDDFLAQVRAQGVQAAPVPLKDVAAPQRAFDGSRIYDDGAILGRWLEARGKSPAPRTALYFNTISLHDGNRLQAEPSLKSTDSYPRRLKKLLDDVQGFTDKLAASGRRAVLVVVPEHGAALRGDAMQIAGLREIPTPAITLVPVGVRVIGPDARRSGDAISSSTPASFLAVSHIVSRMLAKPPFGAAGFRAADYVEGMPATDLVSETEAATVMARGNGYWIREQGAWKEMAAAPVR